MVLPEVVAADACKVRLETLTVMTLPASKWKVRVMFLTVMLTLTRRSPGVYVKIFSSRQPVHSTLFRAAGDKLELLAVALTLLAGSIELFPKKLVIVVG